jgi:hypothetical protein
LFLCVDESPLAELAVSISGAYIFLRLNRPHSWRILLHFQTLFQLS